MDIKELYEIYQKHPVITTDSRNCPAGSIFLALKGASFNGNRFASQALEKGCSYAIVDEKECIPANTDDKGAENDRYILVDDCLQTFKDLAREHRRRFNIPVIGITGTNGKTTTKELIAAVLAEKYNVLATDGNFNNDVGVPKTLFRLAKEHEIAVVEMGASHPGDIKTLVETVEPTCGIITNVGRAHLEGFGSFEGVKRTKGELYDFLSPDGLVFINADNADLMQMAGERGLTELYKYGTRARNGLRLRGEIVSCAPLLKFSWSAGTAQHVVQTHLIGSYNLDNMLAAAAIGLHFGVSEAQICHALESYVPHNNRSQLEQTAHNQLIVDAYNANPTSMAAALQNFKLMEVGPKMAILGKMGELGTISKEEHQKVVDFLVEAQFDEVWLVGEEYFETECPFRRFKDVEEVKAAIAEQRPEGCYILIKGSNSNKLFQLPELL
ncbi:MAG: UDP-N-acetylmuramoyl-tripeptide--D-alanyl-D-alanine ligase [Prevotella sp.]|nr:UDP-N-acetylmuramoyl-tripeptide--D-alanyl-D-alanine ligase [Prevotella sp.]